MLQILELTKRYGRTTAVERLSLTAEAGEVLAILGPNGAGKTTTIRCIVGLSAPTAGTIRVADYDTRRDQLQAKGSIGFVPDRAWFYPKVTARELLRYTAGVRKVRDPAPRIGTLLERFRLADYADGLIESYSHGMRQRLAFCAALVGDPGLLIVDEPMVGLDVRGHLDVKRLFRERVADGRTVVLTTHTLSVAEEVADRIALIDRGRLIALGTMGELRKLASREDANLEELFLHLTGNSTAVSGSGQYPEEESPAA